MESIFRIDEPKSLEKLKNEARKHLNKITTLQGQLSMEEKSLRVLLKAYGSEILS